MGKHLHQISVIITIKTNSSKSDKKLIFKPEIERSVKVSESVVNQEKAQLKIIERMDFHKDPDISFNNLEVSSTYLTLCNICTTGCLNLICASSVKLH